MTTDTTSIVVEAGVKVPMRDGTLLDAMIWRPSAPGRYPVLVERVGYDLEPRAGANGELYARHGYVVVAQNVRGVYASEGDYSLCRDDGWGERQDGYDTIEWAVSQPWSTGRVGMIDGSYSGVTQYLVAPTRPPHLTALYVREGTGDLNREFLFQGGAHSLEMARRWALGSMIAPQLGRRGGTLSDPATRDRVEQALGDLERGLSDLPLKSWPPIEGVGGWYREMLDHLEDPAYWSTLSLARVVSEVDTPILHLGGWYDVFVNGTLRAFTGIRTHGKSAECRAGQRLIVGPWIHGPANVRERQIGEVDFGPEAVFDLDASRLRWYDSWLKGVENGVMDGPPVRLFLMGTNRWIGLEDWPPPGVTCRPLHLASGGEDGRGRLTFEAPPADDAPDSYEYSPDDPVPSLVHGLNTPPTEYRPVEDRLLTYTTAPLEQDLHVVGPIRAVLYAASTAPDTDWVVRLCDVWPDGRSLSVCDGILRARYRESLDRPTLMQPGEVYRFEVELNATAQTFRAGHRLRVHVTSSDFPRYDRNLNTGGLFGEETGGQVATNTVFHDAAWPSHLLLPVMSAGEVEAGLGRLP